MHLALISLSVAGLLLVHSAPQTTNKLIPRTQTCQLTEEDIKNMNGGRKDLKTIKKLQRDLKTSLDIANKAVDTIGLTQGDQSDILLGVQSSVKDVMISVYKANKEQEKFIEDENKELVDDIQTCVNDAKAELAAALSGTCNVRNMELQLKKIQLDVVAIDKKVGKLQDACKKDQTETKTLHSKMDDILRFLELSNDGAVPFHYAGHSYVMFGPEFARKWADARQRCLRLSGGMGLAVIDSAAENEKIVQIISKHFPGGNHFWLGATDKVKEGDWVDLRGRRLTYFNWYPGEPSNSGSNEHCLEIGTHTSQFNDNACHSSRGFICESV